MDKKPKIISKELEALERLGKRAFLTFKEHKKYINAINAWECLPEYKELKQALTPPTAEEVCEAIQNEYIITILYDEEKQSFGYYDEGEWEYITSIEDGYLHIHHELEIKTITLIGRFYEGLENE